MPTILIITANDPNDHLSSLTKEGNDIQYLLNSSLSKNYDVISLNNAESGDIVRELNVPNREVEVLHFAGHSTSQQRGRVHISTKCSIIIFLAENQLITLFCRLR
jgi:hypothetical protein